MGIYNLPTKEKGGNGHFSVSAAAADTTSY